MNSLLRNNWRLLFRYRGLLTWLGLMVVRRRAGNALRLVVRWALVLTVIGAIAALAWWWFNRESGGGEDWRRIPEPEPAPPPPTPEPAVPVGV